MTTATATPLFPTPKLATRANSADPRPAPLEPAALLRLVRQLRPELTRLARREAKDARPSLNRRPASWTLALLVYRASDAGGTLRATERWWEATDSSYWQALGFPRRPGRAELLRYLETEPALNDPALWSLITVAADLVRGGELPDSHITPGHRRRLMFGTNSR